MLENGKETCNCKRKTCERYGDCTACIEHHKTHKRYPLPYCKRKSRERTPRTDRKRGKAAQE